MSIISFDNRDFGAQLTRRNWIKTLVLGGMCLPGSGKSIRSKRFPPSRKIQIGVVADVHQDIIHDGSERIQAFVKDMNQRKPDAIIQLGDFALPRKCNQPFLDAWNMFKGPKYHVLGNHDMADLGFTREQTMNWWRMPERYYSFDLHGWHFVVLDGNDPNPGQWQGYNRYIGEEQQDWLRRDLAKTDFPTIVFSHQQLESDRGINNSKAIRSILNNANRTAGWNKVLACLCGHHHTDKMTEISGIRYIHINSMSYKWVGERFQRLRFPSHIDAAHGNLRNTIPYHDPLYTMLTLDPANGTLQLEGKKTKFIPPTPSDLKLPNADAVRSEISSRKLPITISSK